MQIPTTINESFNNAIKCLLQHHPVFWLFEGPALDIGKRPKGIRSDKEWGYYIGEYTGALLIGRRNKWLSIHVNRKGRPVYWLITIPDHHVKKDHLGKPTKPIYSDEKA